MVAMLLTKLDKDTSDFISTLINKGGYKCKIASLSLAKALSIDLALPADQVDDSGLYFSMTYKTEISEIISIINELISLDKEEILDLVKKFYSYKYNVVYKDDIVPYINKDTAVEDFFGISRVFDVQTLELIKENTSTINSYVNKFISIIQKVRG